MIAVDLDQTLYSFSSRIREAFFELAMERGDKAILRGAYNSSLEWRSLTDAVGEKIAYEAIERVHSNQWKHEPFEGAVEVMLQLAEKNKIVYVTGRLAKHWEETKRWLANWQFPDGELTCTIEPKTPQIINCQYLIDDRPKTIVEFLYDQYWLKDHGAHKDRRIAFGLWEPYNRNLTDIDNVYLAPTWRSLEYYFKKKGLID